MPLFVILACDILKRLDRHARLSVLLFVLVTPLILCCLGKQSLDFFIKATDNAKKKPDRRPAAYVADTTDICEE